MSVKFQIYRQNGTKSDGKLVIKNPAFDIEPHDHAIYHAVRTEMANARQGTASSKTRSDARGGGKKPWRQKGRGAARAGTRRSPIWVGGGKAFGPKPHDFSKKIPKKLKKIARKSALAYKYHEGMIIVLEDLKFEEAKSKNIRDLIRALEIENKSVLLLVNELTENIYLSSRNFHNILLVEAEKASTYDMLRCEVILVEKSGLEKLNSRLLMS